VDGELSPGEREQVEVALAHDPALAAQVAALRASCLPYRSAFDKQTLPPVPEGLTQRLDAWVALAAEPAPAPPAVRTRREWLGWGGALAASFAAGWWVHRPPPEAAPGWVDAIVGYQVLYARETVDALEEDPAHTRRVLADFSAKVNRAVAVPDLRAEGLVFKRAQILALDAAPLLQLVYLPAQGKPVALCVLAQARDDAAVATRRSAGLSVATWRRSGLGYALVADLGSERTEALARGLVTRLG
jgi:anti-sigma factor RsiW